MNKFNVIGALIIVCVFIVAVGLVSCFEFVPLDRVGVRSNQWRGGVEEQDLEPGMWLVIPGIHKMVVMDPTIQEINYSRESQYRRLNLKTRDQQATDLDISIFYRIKPGKAWALLTDIGMLDTAREKVRVQANAVLWETLGKLNTEDFYEATARTQRTLEAVKILNERLGPMNMEVLDILIRRVDFPPGYEKLLVDKQLTDQRTLLAMSRKAREEEREKTEMIRKETEAKVLEIQEEMRKDIQTMTADTSRQINEIEAKANLEINTMLAQADRHKREKSAEGDKLKEIARAKGQKAINEAYQSKGGQLLLSKRMVENLQIDDVEINTNQINPFDVNQFLDMVGATYRK